MLQPSDKQRLIKDDWPLTNEGSTLADSQVEYDDELTLVYKLEGKCALCCRPPSESLAISFTGSAAVQTFRAPEFTVLCQGMTSGRNQKHSLPVERKPARHRETIRNICCSCALGVLIMVA